MDPQLQSELTAYYKSQNEEAKLNPVKKFFRLNNVATLVGIIGSVFGLYQFADKQKEVEKAERELEKISIELNESKRNLETQKQIAELARAQFNIQQSAITDNELELSKQAASIVKLKGEIASTSKSHKDAMKELTSTTALADEVRRALDEARINLKAAQEAEQYALGRYQDITKSFIETRQEYDAYQAKIIEADEKLGNVFKYLDEEKFTEQAICELISINTVVADRKALFAWYSPVVVTVFVSYPDYYKGKLNSVIENVIYKSDINLVGNQSPDIKAYDNNGNHWVWQYTGKTAPTFITATVTYLYDNQLKDFSIKMTWDSNGKASKSTCATT